MAKQNDGMNLLPDRERKEGEAALRRASQAGEKGEVRLVMPQAVTASDQKKSWFSSWKEKRAKAKAERMKAKEEQEKKKAEMVKQAKPSAPFASAPAAPAPVKSAPAKVIVTPKSVPTPKPVQKSAPMPAKAEPVARKPAETPKPAKSVLQPVLEVTSKSEPAMPKTEAVRPGKAKLHEPTGESGFMGPGVNLVPSEVAAAAQGTPWGIYAGILVVVLGVWVGVSGYAISRAKRAETRIQELNARLTQVNTIIKDYEEDKPAHVALQKQFTLVKDLVNAHVYWTPFLQKLEETTIPDVYYLGINANRDGSVTLRAVAKNYASAARQIRAFERASAFVQSVQVNQARQELQRGAALPVPVVAFDVQLKLVSGVFTLSEPEAAATPTAQ